MLLTNNPTEFGHGSLLTRLYTRPVDNQSIIDEEENGFGGSLVGRHVTELADDDVRQRIMQMSVLEIIS